MFITSLITHTGYVVFHSLCVCACRGFKQMVNVVLDQFDADWADGVVPGWPVSHSVTSAALHSLGELQLWLGCGYGGGDDGYGTVVMLLCDLLHYGQVVTLLPSVMS